MDDRNYRYSQNDDDDDDDDDDDADDDLKRITVNVVSSSRNEMSFRCVYDSWFEWVEC